MSDPLVLTRPLAGAMVRLADERRAPAGWYVRRPGTPAEWRAHVERVRADFAGRQWHAALAPAIEASGAAAARLARVADGSGVVVTTGQQPGLFGGPVYTWSKALSAIALADAIEAETGMPAAPLFWAATYDADFAEASVSYVALNDRVERLQMAPPERPGRAMRDTPLGDVGALADALAAAAGAAVNPAIIDLVRACYAPGETVGGAYVRLLRALLEPLGMAVLDAGHAASRAAQHAFLVRALADAAAVDAAVVQRDAELRAAGQEPKVAHVPGLTLVFAVGSGERRRIPISGADAARTARDASELEPNVLLRPVSERSMLPTAAYVAGPGELAYFAQSSAVASALGAPMPLALPRWSGLIVEPHVRRILERYGLAVDDLRDPHAALTRLAKEQLPDAVRSALDRYRASLDEAAAALARAVAGVDPPLLPGPVLGGAASQIRHRIDHLERRAVAVSKRRHDAVVRDVETAQAALFPLGRMQERTLNLIPMLARHGTPLLDAMLERARDHAAAITTTAPAEALATHGHAGDHG